MYYIHASIYKDPPESWSPEDACVYPEDRDSGFDTITQELTLVDLLEEPGVMTLDTWYHI